MNWTSVCSSIAFDNRRPGYQLEEIKTATVIQFARDRLHYLFGRTQSDAIHTSRCGREVDDRYQVGNTNLRQVDRNQSATFEPPSFPRFAPMAHFQNISWFNLLVSSVSLPVYLVSHHVLFVFHPSLSFRRSFTPSSCCPTVCLSPTKFRAPAVYNQLTFKLISRLAIRTRSCGEMDEKVWEPNWLINDAKLSVNVQHFYIKTILYVSWYVSWYVNGCEWSGNGRPGNDRRRIRCQL